MINGINEKVSQLNESAVNLASNQPWGKIALVAGSVALSILFPPVIIPVIVTFACIFAGKAIVYIKEKTSCQLCQKMEEINKKFPWLKWVLLIFTISLGLMNPVSGAIFGGVTGIYVGIVGINCHATEESLYNA